MTDYSSFSVEEFINDEYFRKSVLAPSMETDAFWATFLQKHPQQLATITSARAFFKALDQLQTYPSSEQGQRMWEGIERQTQQSLPERNVRSKKRPHLGWWAAGIAAASIIALVWFRPVSGVLEISQPLTATVVDSTWVLRVNSTQQLLTFQLSDGSEVMLSPQSQIRYPRHFEADKREVHLVGEGFFKVAKNPRQPFFVFAKNLITQVIGTSFRITAFAEASQVKVTVRTGNVAVYSALDAKTSLLLTANEQVQFDAGSQKLTKSMIPSPTLLQATQEAQSFAFDNAPIAEVFQTLEKSYGVTITYDAGLLKNCSLTAPLSNESFFKKLDLICQTIGATYEVWGSQIIITAKGC